MSVVADVNGIISKLKSDGFRITPARIKIVDILTKASEPVSAIDLLEVFSNSEKSVNKTTVYRELDFLMEQKLIQSVEFGDGKKRYELNLSHHHHLICLNCKKVEDVDLKLDLKNEEKRIEKETGFKIDSHSLEFFGFCKKCQ